MRAGYRRAVLAFARGGARVEPHLWRGSMLRKALVLGVLLAGLVGALIAVLPSEAAPPNQAAGLTLSVQPVAAQGFAGCQATVSVIATGAQNVAGLQRQLNDLQDDE